MCLADKTLWTTRDQQVKRREMSTMTSIPMKARRKASSDDEPVFRAHLLVVEDEKDLRELLRYNLERDGFRVTVAENGTQALKLVEAAKPDLILLDLMLPGIDGLEVCRTLTADGQHAKIPIVMLTAKSEEADVVTGLELGAADYVTKPFSPRVLLARIRNVLKRSKAARDGVVEPASAVIRVDNLTVDPARHEVRVGDQPVDLTATEFKLLSLLTRRPGCVFTRSQIIEAIHGRKVAVTDRSVDVQIVALRRKLGDVGEAIETVRGVGYRFRDPM